MMEIFDFWQQSLPQLLQGFAQVAEIVGLDRKQAGEHPRLDLLKARQRLHRRSVRSGKGVAHRRAVDVLDPGYEI